MSTIIESIVNKKKTININKNILSTNDNVTMKIINVTHNKNHYTVWWWCMCVGLFKNCVTIGSMWDFMGKGKETLKQKNLKYFDFNIVFFSFLYFTTHL